MTEATEATDLAGQKNCSGQQRSAKSPVRLLATWAGPAIKGSSEPPAYVGTLGGTFSLEESDASNPSFCSDCDIFLFRKALLLSSSIVKVKNVESHGLILPISRKVTEGCFLSGGALMDLFSVAAKSVTASAVAHDDADY